MLNIDPDKLQVAKNILSVYKEDDDLIWFNILHIYPDYETKLVDDDCYRNSLKFKAVAYNTKLKKFKELNYNHDQLNFRDFWYNSVLPLDIFRVFADGSILIIFDNVVRIASPFAMQVIDLTTKEINYEHS